MSGGWRRGWARLLAFFSKQRLDEELDAELASHLLLAEDDLIARGVEPREARRLARLQLGGLGSVREAHRDSRGLPQLDVLQQDLRHAFRTLRRDRAFTVVAVLVLALGLGATATVYSVVDAVLLKPLPFDEPDRLVWITNGPKVPGEGLSAITTNTRVFQEWSERSRSFESLAAFFAFFSYDAFELQHGDRASRLAGVGVTWNFLDALGVSPHLGRSFSAAESQAQSPPVVILSHNLWRQHFRADQEIIGQAVTLDNEPVTVVGVLPESFDFGSVFAPGSQVDLLTPLALETMGDWGNTLAVIGRLRPQVSVDQAQSELAAVTDQMLVDRPELGRGYASDVITLNASTRRSARQGLLLLLGCVGAVLAIAAANISGLQIARAAKRRQEFAVRAALGAGRARLLRQWITEGLVLASLSALLGTVLAYAAITAVTHLPNASLPLLDRVQLDGGSLLCIALAAIVVGVVCGLTPVFQASFSNLQKALKDGARGSSGGSWQTRARSGLVIAETALACMLLIAATLLMRSFSQILQVDLGFQPQHALSLTVEPDVTLQSTEAKLAYIQRLRDGLVALPEVSGVGFTDALPLDRHRSWSVTLKEHSYPEDQLPAAFLSRVTPEVFDALGISLHQGRLFTEAEIRQDASVVIINERLAEGFWAGEDPLGETVVVGGDDFTVVGVVGDVHHLGVESAAGFNAYLPIALDSGPGTFTLVMRTGIPPATAADSVRQALRTLDPMLPVDDLRPLSWFVDRATFSRRFVASLLGGFAAFALLLACLGIYGVIAYATGRRRREIGLRMALGATGNDILRRVLGDTLALAAAGVVLGTLGGVLLGHAMRSLLFGISPTDLPSFGVMLVVMSAVSLAAGLIPALRAARIEPGSTLRSP